MNDSTTAAAEKNDAEQTATVNLDREAFLNAGKVKYGFVDTDHGRAYFRSLSEFERALIDGDLYDDDGRVIDNATAIRRAKLITAAVVDKEGKRLFADNEWESVAKLNSRLTKPIFRSLVKHLGLDAEVEETETAKK